MEDDDQTRKSPIPVPPIPDLAGKRGGNPASRFGRDREARSRPGTGNRGPAGGMPDFLV